MLSKHDGGGVVIISTIITIKNSNHIAMGQTPRLNMAQRFAKSHRGATARAVTAEALVIGHHLWCQRL